MWVEITFWVAWKGFFLLVNGFKMKLIGTQRKMPVYSLAMNIFSMDINHLMTDGPQGKQWFLFPWDLQCSLWLCLRETMRFSGKQNTLFPLGPVIKCFVIPPDSKMEQTAKILFAWCWLAYKFAVVLLRCKTWSCASQKFKLLFA